MAVGKINLQKYSGDDTATKEIEEIVWLNDIQKIKYKNKPKIDFSNES